MSKPRRVVALVELCTKNDEPYWYLEDHNVTCIHVNVHIKGAPVCGDVSFVYIQGDHTYVNRGDMLVLEKTDDSTGTMFTKQYEFWRIVKQDD